MFTRDILRTLLLKLTFLVLLWLICFKDAQKNNVDAAKWLYGVHKTPTFTQKSSLKQR